jgi:RimJ/RimL family protein N-acetyltransferase
MDGGSPAADQPLRTDRLILRRARIDDLDAMHRVLSDPRAMRYWSTSAHSSLDETERWLRAMIVAPPERSNDFVLELGGRVIGKAGCWRLPEIGFILHPDYWGLGLAQEALAAAIASTFSEFAVQQLTADVDPRNHACLRLLRHLGFRETGRADRTWFVNSEWADSVYLALCR